MKLIFTFPWRRIIILHEYKSLVLDEEGDSHIFIRKNLLTWNYFKLNNIDLSIKYVCLIIDIVTLAFNNICHRLSESVFDILHPLYLLHRSTKEIISHPSRSLAVIRTRLQPRARKNQRHPRRRPDSSSAPIRACPLLRATIIKIGIPGA